jgi:ArsR family transcriptional regulator
VKIAADCCPPILDEPLTTDEAATLAGWFGVLADPTRLRLLSLIAAKGEACAACGIVDPLGVSQPTVSHHLKALHEAGLVERERRGRWIYYSVRADRLAVLSRSLGATA